jgi:hypothetical protein
MAKPPDPTYETPDSEHGSVQEPDGAEGAMDDAFVDAFIERNRDELIRSMEEAERDFAEGRCTPWEDVKARILEKLRASAKGE